jgi:hypothetical protein
MTKTDDRSQFEAELAQALTPPAPPEGTGAAPSASVILLAVTELLKDGGIKDQLLSIYRRLKGEQPA